MTRITLVYQHESYPKDVTRIVRAFAAQGFHCSRLQARELWEQYSDSMCAGWLIVDSYDDVGIVQALRPYFVEVDD